MMGYGLLALWQAATIATVVGGTAALYYTGRGVYRLAKEFADGVQMQRSREGSGH